MPKKIIAFIGVNKEKSSTVDYIKDVLQRVKEIERVDVKIHTQLTSKLEICRGCCQCFYTHKCPLDNVDHMDKLKQELLDADFVIFGSPVYMHSLSGSMKNFFDRLSYWSHIFALRGKNSMVVSSADSNGGNLTTNYMAKILSYLGCPVIATANIFSIKNYDDGQKDVHAAAIINSLRNPVKSSKDIEKIYQGLNMVMNARVQLPRKDVEYEYWKEHGLLNSESFESLV